MINKNKPANLQLPGPRIENIRDVNIVKQYRADSVEYLLEVNRRRQIPDGKDGLKVVQRRILDAMFKNSKCFNKQTQSKSAAVVGDTLRKSHPHSDSSVYDAMKPLTNWFECYVPFIQGEGSIGSLISTMV